MKLKAVIDYFCPLDVLNVLYCHQSVLCVFATWCHVARLRVELRGGGVCLCGSPVLGVASTMAVEISIQNYNSTYCKEILFFLCTFFLCTFLHLQDFYIIEIFMRYCILQMLLTHGRDEIN